MHEIKADQEKNRLYITLTGVIQPDESKTISECIQKELKGLETRFVCIVDFTRFKMKPGDAEWLVGIQDLLAAAGISEIIRIGDQAPHELLEKNSRKAGYSGKLAHDLESAIRIVEQRE